MFASLRCFLHIRLYKGSFRVICQPSFKFNRIRFLPSLKDVIYFMKSIYVNRVTDVAVVYEKVGSLRSYYDDAEDNFD